MLGFFFSLPLSRPEHSHSAVSNAEPASKSPANSPNPKNTPRSLYSFVFDSESQRGLEFVEYLLSLAALGNDVRFSPAGMAFML